MVGLVAGAGPAGAATTLVESHGALSDFSASTASATDGAAADVWAVAGASGMTVMAFITGLDPAAAGKTYGAHIHVGPCVAGAGATAGAHYNAGGTPTADSEVWLDFTVLSGGYGYASVRVPFTIEPGKALSMVIHAEPTQDGGATPGAAGARLACLPVVF